MSNDRANRAFLGSLAETADRLVSGAIRGITPRDPRDRVVDGPATGILVPSMRFVFALLSLALVACVPSFDDLQGGCRGGVCSDAGADASFGGDAGADVVGTDGGGPCTSKLCASFDPPSDVSPWGFQSVNGDPTRLSLDKTMARSSPNALHIRAAPADGVVALVMPFTAGAETRWGFALRVQELAGSTATDVVLLELRCAANAFDLKLKRTGRLQIQYAGVAADLDGIDPAAGWIGVDVHWILGTGELTLTTTGGVNATRSITTPPQTCATQATAELGFVDLGVTREGTYDVLIDDVHGDWQ